MDTKRDILILTLIYTTAWFTVHLLVLPSEWLLYAAAIALLYGGGHYRAGMKRGHIALSADAVALPLAFVAMAAALAVEFSAVSGALEAAGSAAEQSELIAGLTGIITAFGIAFVAGHALTFLLVYLYSALYEKA